MIHGDNNAEHQLFDAQPIINVAPVTDSFDAIRMSQHTTSVHTKENTVQHISLSTNISVVDHVPVFDVTKFLTNLLNKRKGKLADVLPRDSKKHNQTKSDNLPNDIITRRSAKNNAYFFAGNP